MIAIHQLYPGWERVFLAAFCPLAYTIFKFQFGWKNPAFWLIHTVCLLLQILLLPQLRGFLNETRAAGLIAVSIAQLMLLITAITFFVHDPVNDEIS